MNCKPCGAPINPHQEKCEYCQTYYPDRKPAQNTTRELQEMVLAQQEMEQRLYATMRGHSFFPPLDVYSSASYLFGRLRGL